ncbi:PAS domain S-box protein [Pleurocapsa sp. PCC 7319]|uniref:PAS domain S-box protein n=1 Tax=Pleurocapsa sp. PCC 7319 TaxID=118161 RepID=UPI000348BEA1|nr:PAS domain S-box protein [Pleurocapsa sp. PCC 7319]
MVQQQSENLTQSINDQDYHRTLWNNSPIPQAVYQFNGTILDANQAFANLIGRTLIATLGLNIWAITPAKYHASQSIDRASLDTKGKFTAERSYLDANGQPIPVSLSGVKIELEEQSLILLSVEQVGSPSSSPQFSKSVSELQSILDAMPMAIFWKDCNSVYLGCNQRFVEVSGFNNQSEIVGKTDYDLPWKKEEADWFRECDRRVVESQTSEYNIIEPQQQADGSQRWLKTNKMLLHDSHRNIVGIVGTFEDITERVELEQQLQTQTQNLENLIAKRTEELIASKARFEKLVVNVPGSIYQFKQEIDGSFSFPYISSDCHEICEVSSDLLMSNSELILSLIHPEDLSSFEQVVEKSAQTLQPKYWEGRITTPSGKTKWIQTASKPEKQADGSIIWDGLMIDISDRKQAEQELRESQQLLRLIFDTLPQRFFWKDKNFNYLGCNQLFAQDAGLNSPEEIIGKNDFELSWHKSAHLYRADDEVILAGGTPKINYEESQIREDGSILILRTNKIALKDKNGRIIGLFGSYEDVSDISNQKQQTENAKDFLEKAIDSISSPIFVKDTNHQWVLVNDAYCKFIGASKAEILGKSEPDFFPQEQADIYWAKDELVMLSGGQEIDEEPFTDEEGNDKIIITKKSCFQNLDGNTFLLGMITDITDV